MKDGFPLGRRQHPEFGGLRFSQLTEEIQSQFLSFEIAVDLLINLPDPEILDIFARLNSYAVVLNEQEKINASHFGPFKNLADKIGFDYNEYWRQQEILTAQQILRMQEVNLVADLIISMLEGIKSKKSIKRYYANYEKEFTHDSDDLEARFRSVINKIAELFPEGLSGSEFRRVHIFYSLFTAIFHCLIGLPNLQDSQKRPVPMSRIESEKEIESARNGLDIIAGLFAAEPGTVTGPAAQFLQDSRRATTDEAVRERRTVYLLKLINTGSAD